MSVHHCPSNPCPLCQPPAAKAIETGTVETVGLGPKDESAVAQAICPKGSSMMPDNEELVERLLHQYEHEGAPEETREAATLIEQLSNRVERLTELLGMWRKLVSEGGVPRYTVTPGAALNTLVTWTDAALARARSGEHQSPTTGIDNG